MWVNFLIDLHIVFEHNLVKRGSVSHINLNGKVKVETKVIHVNKLHVNSCKRNDDNRNSCSIPTLPFIS